MKLSISLKKQIIFYLIFNIIIIYLIYSIWAIFSLIETDPKVLIMFQSSSKNFLLQINLGTSELKIVEKYKEIIFIRKV